MICRAMIVRLAAAAAVVVVTGRSGVSNSIYGD